MIVVYGTVCLDRLRRIPEWPSLGGYVEMTSDETLLGGEAANTASHLARWGCDIRLAGNGVGGGDEGKLLLKLLSDHRLPADLLPQGGVTPICEVYVTPDGERTMIGKGFSSMEFSSPMRDFPWQTGAWFTAEPNLGDRARDAAHLAIANGMKTYLMDFFKSGDPIVPGSFWQCSTDWIGFKSQPEKNVQFVDEWTNKHGCFAILTDGPNGYVAGGFQLPAKHFHSPPAPQNTDATGAGDAFRAGMLYGLSNLWPIEKCLCFAAASGALKCAALGGAAAKHSVADTRQLADHFALAT